MAKTPLPNGGWRYTEGGYSVDVGPNGEILVKPGDSLSKYSMAINGHFGESKEWNEFKHRRNKPTGPISASEIKNIPNAAMIYSGEILYHVPSIPGNSPPAVPSDPALTEQEIYEMLRKAGFPRSYKPAARFMYDSMRLGHATVSLVNIFLASGTIAFAGGLSGAFMSIVGNCVALYHARNYDLMQTKKRATVYGAVAWAFDDSSSLPTAMEKSMAGLKSDTEIALYKHEWSTAVALVKSRLDSHCLSNGINVRDGKLAMQAMSLSYGRDSNVPMPEWLAAGTLVEVAYHEYPRSLDRFYFLQPWSWYPNDKEVGRPNYPPLIENRYPYS